MADRRPQHPYGRVVEGWPSYWRIGSGFTAHVWPPPGPETERFQLEGWGAYYLDPRDEDTAEVLYKSSLIYWRRVREGDIFIEGPFAGLPAH